MLFIYKTKKYKIFGKSMIVTNEIGYNFAEITAYKEKNGAEK